MGNIIDADKELLLRDLCAMLPYGVMVSVQGGEFDSYKYPYQLTAVSKFGLDSFCKVYHPIYTPFEAPNVEDTKPYLRPMSSMTEEELSEFRAFHCLEEIHPIFYPQMCNLNNINNMYDWLNAHHFDYNGLIEKGLALEAPEGMYNN